MIQSVATGKETRLLLPSAWNNTQDERCRMNISMIDETVGPLEEIAGEAVRVLDAANADDIPLRLLGGLAIYLQSSSAKTHEQLKRSYKDLDFVVLSKF